MFTKFSLTTKDNMSKLRKKKKNNCALYKEI